MYLVLLALPLLGYVVCTNSLYLCSFISVTIFICFGVAQACIGLLVLWEAVLHSCTCVVTLWSWMAWDYVDVSCEFLFDELSVTVTAVVVVVSTLISTYSVWYMGNDASLVRFLGYLSLFTVFMLLMVCSGNLVLYLLGWEGVGLCSYLLIGFWTNRSLACKSAVNALVMNRAGDVCLVIGVLLVATCFDSVDLLFAMGSITLLLFMGLLGKSSQLGLHMWLPDAMEGPTIVSALIHSATMVVAGVYLLISFSFECISDVLVMIAWVSGVTALYGGLCGVYQSDLKNVIALSTCSQLGCMVLCCGLSAYSNGLFHIITHSFFKALVFLCFGVVIHYCVEQDTRFIGSSTSVHIGLVIYDTSLGSRTGTALLVERCGLMGFGVLSLIGCSLMSGGWSKDTIGLFIYSSSSYWELFVLLGLLTVVYSVSLLSTILKDTSWQGI